MTCSAPNGLSVGDKERSGNVRETIMVAVGTAVILSAGACLPGVILPWDLNGKPVLRSFSACDSIKVDLNSWP